MTRHQPRNGGDPLGADAQPPLFEGHDAVATQADRAHSQRVDVGLPVADAGAFRAGTDDAVLDHGSVGGRAADVHHERVGGPGQVTGASDAGGGPGQNGLDRAAPGGLDVHQ